MQRAHRTEFRGTDRFQLLSLVGVGGMGVVYEAFDEKLGCRVALKLLRSLTPEGIVRFKNEFRALQNIHHPNLVSLGELVEDEGRLFFTMELVGGVDIISYAYGSSAPDEPRSMRRQLASDEPTLDPTEPIECTATTRRAAVVRAEAPSRRAPDELRVRRSFEQLARGLMALHSHGKIHRDIKPSNVLVTENDRVVILDFGLIADVSDGSPVTERHAVGTVGYMSPEQSRGHPVDPASDWYSFGAMLREVLTGEPTGRLASDTVSTPRSSRSIPSADETNGAPEGELITLCQALLRQNPAERPNGTLVLSVLRETPPSAISSGSRTPNAVFVGRKTELEMLERAYEHAAVEGPVAVIIEGESGVGKTSLVSEFVEKMRRSGRRLRALRGACSERESIPYKALDRIVEQATEYLHSLPADRRADLVPEATLSRLARAFPVVGRLLQRTSEYEVFGSDDPQVERMRVLRAARELFTALTDDRDLILCIDDWQWADADSVAILSTIVAGPSAPRLLLVLAQRTGLAAPVLDLPTERLSLTGLGPLNARELAGALLRTKVADDALLARMADIIAEEANGQPLFIWELARHARGYDPSSAPRLRFDEMVAQRMDELDESSRRVVEFVSLSGGPVPLPVIAAALSRSGAKLNPTDLPRIVSQLRAEHFVHSDGLSSADSIDRYHDRIAKAVVDRIDAPVRRRYHEALALALEAAGSVDFEMLAGHWKDAGARDKAFRPVLAAAEAAAAALAFDRAARLYRLGLDLCEPSAKTDVQQKLGDALASLGHGVEAAHAYVNASTDASAERHLELLRRAADQLFRSGYIDEAISTLARVLEDMGLTIPNSPGKALLKLGWERSRLLHRGLRFRERRAAEIAPRDLIQVDTCWTVAIGLSTVDNLRGACLQTRHLRLALDIGEPFRVVRALAAEAGYVAVAGSHTRARTDKLLEMANGLAERIGDAYAFGFIHLAAAICKFLRGEWQGARIAGERAEAIFEGRPAGASWELASARMFSIWASFYDGHWGALRRVPELIAEAESRGDRYAATCQRIGLCNLAWLMSGNAEEARAQVNRAEAEWSSKGYHFQHYWLLVSAAHLDLYDGDAHGAYERVKSAWTWLRRELLLRTELLRLEVLWLRGRTALAAASTASHPSSLLADARWCARKLCGTTVPWARRAGLLLEAGHAASSGKHDKAIELLRSPELETGPTSDVLALFAKIRRIGLASPGSGRLPREWQEFTVSQGLPANDRFLELFAPGFPL